MKRDYQLHDYQLSRLLYASFVITALRPLIIIAFVLVYKSTLTGAILTKVCLFCMHSMHIYRALESLRAMSPRVRTAHVLG